MGYHVKSELTEDGKNGLEDAIVIGYIIMALSGSTGIYHLFNSLGAAFMSLALFSATGMGLCGIIYWKHILQKGKE